MPRRFKDKLKAIRDASTAKSQQDDQARKEEDRIRSERTAKGFEFREHVERLIEEFARNFEAEAPGFALNRGFYESKYMLALRINEELADANGTVDRYFSRLMFLLSPDLDQQQFHLQCRKTIRNRDQESVSLEQPMTEVGLAAVGTFVETQFIAFAEAYFAHNQLTRPAPVGALAPEAGNEAPPVAPSDPAPPLVDHTP